MGHEIRPKETIARRLGACLHGASMMNVATLYVRDIPPELYEQVKDWAKKSKRSVNAEMLALLEEEAARRGGRSEWFEDLLRLRKELSLSREDADLMIQAIRDHRDGRDH